MIGDRCIDEYHYGKVNRLSPEAPVPIFIPRHTISKNGMASNVEDNLKALDVDVISYFGHPSIKIRMIDERSNQQLLRIDKDQITNPLEFTSLFLPKDIDGIIVSDYEKGLITYELLESLIKTELPVFIDTKKTNLKRLDGAFVKINTLEFEKAKTFPNNLIITRGKKGAEYKNKIYPAPEIAITDVCGAGDTFLASFSYKYLLTKNVETSIEFAIKASSITVQHLGVYAPTLKEILC